MEKQLRINSVLFDIKNGKSYRIIHFDSTSTAIVIELETTKFNIFIFPILDILKYIQEGNWDIKDESIPVLDAEKLNQKQKEKFQRRFNFIKEIEKRYGPSYIELIGKKSKVDFDKIQEKYNFSRAYAWRLIRDYLQSGNNLCKLASYTRKPKKSTYTKNKVGRKGSTKDGVSFDAELERIFEEGLNEYKNNRNNSMQLVYDRICLKYYSKIVDGAIEVLPQSLRPTYRQFSYYCTSHLSKEDMKTIKTSKQEYRNNNRLLTGTADTNVFGPGDLLEMDALEMDVEIVSETDRSKIIGRPIMYALIDVFSRAVVAFSISLENNSVLGMTNCLMNLGEDKDIFCKQYGVTGINLKLWPSEFIPNRIRVDRGSDFISKEAERIFNELNITREIVTGATGSLKGVIEQLWHQIHSAQNSSLKNAGLIEKRYDSTHKKRACLTINEITKMIIVQILAHNGLQMNGYRLTKEMLENNVVPTPSNIWEFGVNKYGAPRPILNKKQYAYSLMTKPIARISRKGVCVDGLYYISNDTYLLSKMIEAGNKSIAFDCRYDERNITNIYYLAKGELKTASLNLNIPNQSDFINNSRKSRLDFLENEKKLKKENEQKNQTLRSSRIAVLDSVVNNAKQNTSNKPLNDKNIRENRKQEQESQKINNTIASKLLNNKPEAYDPIKALMEAQIALQEEEDKKYGIVYEED